MRKLPQVLITLLLILSSLSLFSITSEPALSRTLILEGEFQGKNVFVQNPISNAGAGYCIKEVTVNGQVTTDEINSNTFEIDLNSFQLKIGEKVIVKIKHQKGCTPIIMNPEVFLPESTFELVSIEVSEKGLIKWSTKLEQGKIDFIIEQYKWNKWVKCGEVYGKGLSTINDYQFKTTLNSGENKFRVKQIGQSGKPRYSRSVTFNSKLPVIDFHYDKQNKRINFSGKTLFELYDSIGNILKIGYSKSINVENFNNGVYYLNFDNLTKSIVIK